MPRRTDSILLTLALAALVAAAGCRDGGAGADTARPDHLVDLEGRVVTMAEAIGDGPTVFIFLRRDCPISNRYAPEIRRVQETYEPRGVRLWLVYPDPEATAEQIRKHGAEFKLPADVLRDPHHALVRKTGARVTPEAAVFVDAGEPIYCGRIDDLYVDFGTSRQAPTTHDLADALEAVLGGRPVATRRTKAVGCYIVDLQ